MLEIATSTPVGAPGTVAPVPELPEATEPPKAVPPVEVVPPVDPVEVIPPEQVDSTLPLRELVEVPSTAVPDVDVEDRPTPPDVPPEPVPAATADDTAVRVDSEWVETTPELVEATALVA
jgi:hypothetical protein